MRKKTVIYLHSNDAAQASFACIDALGTVVHSGVGVSLTEITTIAHDTDVIVIVPAVDVLLMQVTLPKLNRQRVRQALPFALEESLITDVDKLHFAIADEHVDHTWPVAIVEKSTMEFWLTQLQTAQLKVTALVPASLLLPNESAQWSIVVDQQDAMVRTGKYQGFGCDAHNLATVLTLQLQETAEKPQYIHLYHYDAEIIELPISVPIQHISSSAEQWIIDLARWASSSLPLNLLQKDYCQTHTTSSVKKQWLWASGLALSSIVVVWFFHVLSFIALEWQSYRLDKSIASLYKKNFPQAQTVSAVKERMQQKLKTLTGQTQNRFLMMMTQVGQAFTETPGIHMMSIHFQQTELSMELTAPSLILLDQFTQSLQQQGFNVTQQQVTNSPTQAKATLLISGGTV